MNSRYCLFLLVLGLCLCFQSRVIAQNISGKVLDMNGNPVFGALVVSKNNHSIKVLTDEKGNFEMVGAIGDKFVVTTPDHASKTVVAQKYNEVKMNRINAPVEIGNTITQSKFESTAATSTIYSDDIMKSSAMNASNALYGRGLGLTALQNDGFEYDSNTTFNIRGLGSLQGNTPYVLVDGFERPLSSLVKEEIESITVLKDAASLAMYGFKGSNGVMLVTTKKGVIGKTQIDFSYEHSFIEPLHKPEFVNAYTYATAVNEARANDQIATPLYDANQLAAFKNGNLPDYYANVNWVDQILKNKASSSTYNISVRGGNSRMRYFTVMNLASNDGLMKPTNNVSAFSSQFKYSRLNVRTNLDVQLTPTTNVSVKLLGSLIESNRPGNVIGTIMTSMYNTPSAAFPVKTSKGEWGGSDTWTKNPVAMVAAQGYGKTDSRTLFADWSISQDLSGLVDGLSADLSIGFDNYADYWESMSQTYRYAKNTTQFTATGDTISNRTTSVGTNSAPTYSSSLGTQWRHFNAFAKVAYDKDWKHVSLNSSLMFFHDQYVGSGQFTTTNRQRINGYSHIGFFDKYFVDLSLTANGTNRLQPKHNIGIFPAIGSAWVLSKEDIFKDVKALNLLKIRASYGVVGNDYTSSSELFKQTYGTGGSYIFTDSYTNYAGMTELRLATMGLTYEKSHKTNIGLDARLLNAIDLTAEVYYERRTDILVSTSGSISSVIGATPSMSNDGIVDNKGVELGLNINQSVGDFEFNVGGQFTFARSKVINQNEGFVQYDYLKQTGKPVSQIFGYESIGYFKDQADIAASPSQWFSPVVVPGDIKFKDQNGDKRINELDKVALGYNANCPEMYFSVNFNLEYKGLGIDANFQGVGNYSAVLNTASVYWPLRNNTNLSTYYYENRWTPDNQNARFPRLSTLQNDNNYNTNSVWVTDRSYIKLRTCELYYKFPEKLVAKSFLTKAKIYARGMNLLSFDNFKVDDPESYGIAYPMTASFDLGVNIGF